MKIIRDLAALRAGVGDWKAAGDSIGVVPTMGALHPGHLSLVAAAKAACDRVIVTLFVNPRQFNNPADLEKYPRTEASDEAMLAPAGVDLLFAPDAATVYPQGFATKVTVAALSEVLCGAHRPGHFDGVATVVPKLLLMTGADAAFFGEKDWQQLQIIRRVVADLNLPVTITGCPTVREADGLAMSSRNKRLTSADRAIAPALQRSMAEATRAVRAGSPVAKALPDARTSLLRSGFSEIEYLEFRSADDLSRAAPPFPQPTRLFAAAWLGGVRLIDNIAV